MPRSKQPAKKQGRRLDRQRQPPDCFASTLSDLEKRWIEGGFPSELVEAEYEINLMEVLGYLSRSQNLGKTWKALRKRKRLSEKYAMELAHTLAQAHYGANYKGLLSAAKSKIFYRELAGSLQDIASRLEPKAIGRRPVPIARTLMKDDRSYLGYLLQEEGVPPAYHKDAVRALQSFLLSVEPDYLSILQEFSDMCREQAARPRRRARTKGRAARANHMADAVMSYFKRQHGSPLYAHAAALTNAVCGSCLDSESIRKLFSRAKKAKKPGH